MNSAYILTHHVSCFDIELEQLVKSSHTPHSINLHNTKYYCNICQLLLLIAIFDMHESTGREPSDDARPPASVVLLCPFGENSRDLTLHVRTRGMGGTPGRRNLHHWPMEVIKPCLSVKKQVFNCFKMVVSCDCSIPQNLKNHFPERNFLGNLGSK